MRRPLPGEYGDFYQRYIDYTKGETIQEVLSYHMPSLDEFYNNLPAEKADFAYAADKWTVKQLIQHLIDTERVFTYRLTRVSRNDNTPIPGFDENNYAENAPATNRTLTDLLKEFYLLRQSTTLFIRSLSEEQINRKGNASGWPITANALCYIIVGHNLHHKKILEERYNFY
jgi:uncharacterized damage-inducible protein DinB